jgi:hypothetical protein
LWENIGVAPIYKEYKLALRLKNSQRTLVLATNANLLTWMPGDIVHDETLFVPFDIPVGTYKLEIAIVSPVSFEPRIKLAIRGATEDGWYPMGDILVQDK